jgi:hypothetical protein
MASRVTGLEPRPVQVLRYHSDAEAVVIAAPTEAKRPQPRIVPTKDLFEDGAAAMAEHRRCRALRKTGTLPAVNAAPCLTAGTLPPEGTAACRDIGGGPLWCPTSDSIEHQLVPDDRDHKPAPTKRRMLHVVGQGKDD